MHSPELHPFVKKAKAHPPCLGAYISLRDPLVSEIMASAGYDFLWIDMEHGAITLETALLHVMACKGTPCAPLIRVPSHDPCIIKPILELEPAGIIIPRIRSAEEVSIAIDGCKYPPEGSRGFGPHRGMIHHKMNLPAYLTHARQYPLIFVQIEHIDAVHTLDAILEIKGLDGVAIGPNDLAGSMGQLGNPSHPDVIKAMDITIKKTLQSNKLLGVATGHSIPSTTEWIKKGIQWIALNSDYGNLYQASKTIVDDVMNIKNNLP